MALTDRADTSLLQTVRHDCELGFWESTTREPAPELRELIKGPYQGWVENAFIVNRIAHAKPPSPGICWAWRQLNETGGLIGVGALADELGCSHKHLITQFRREIGLPPKALARIVRFSRVAEMLKRNEVASWVQIAHRCGYYDQAHLIRDFREFAGSTPTEYVGRILPDGGGVAGD